MLLNKKYPFLSKSDKFMPISILSPLYKFLELRFYNKVVEYMFKRINSN